MSGKVFLDTNAIVQLLKGNFDVLKQLHDAEHIATSIICELEFLAFQGLRESDKQLFYKFMSQVAVIDLKTSDDVIKKSIIELRQKNKLKLPDAIVCAMAKAGNATLITADKQLLKIDSIETHTFKTI